MIMSSMNQIKLESFVLKETQEKFDLTSNIFLIFFPKKFPTIINQMVHPSLRFHQGLKAHLPLLVSLSESQDSDKRHCITLIL